MKKVEESFYKKEIVSKNTSSNHLVSPRDPTE